jgi:hypothetical protein
MTNGQKQANIALVETKKQYACAKRNKKKTETKKKRKEK